MQKLLYILLSTLLFSCSKAKVDYVFDKLPEQRMKERNSELQNLLTGSTNGWKAFLRTSLNGGGYGFYMKFDNQDYVTMVSDWNNTNATTQKQSTYRVQYISNATLIFDSYNYISILQDPMASVNGGNAREGLQSDVEFEYLRNNGDTVFLKGRKYQNILYLIKASAAEGAIYNNGGYGTAINDFINFLGLRKSNSFTVNGKTVDLFFNFGNKTLSALTAYSKDSIVNVSGGFAYALDGAVFTDNFILDGVKITYFKVKDANTAVVMDASGKEYPLVAASRPVVDLKNIFAYNSIFKGIIIRGQTLPGGVNSSFNTVFTGMVSRFNSTSRNIESVEFRFGGSNSFSVNIWYVTTAGARFLADATFTYTYNDGVITLSKYTPGSNGNWTTRINEIGNFATWVQSGPFKVDWAISSSSNVGVLGGLYKVSNEADFFYGSPNQ